MNAVLRGLRIIDPLSGHDLRDRDVWIRDGRLIAVDRSIETVYAELVDLTPPPGGEQLVLAPAFIDLHAHLRDPGQTEQENLESGAAAAAAGGFGQVVAMANTKPVIDTPERVEELVARVQAVPVRIAVAAAMSRDLAGAELVDVAACAAVGAACISDDGRNAASAALLIQALERADEAGLSVLVHPEDEAMVAAANPGLASVVRCPERPAEAEVAAVAASIAALRSARRGRLHLQHLSTAGSLEHLRAAREDGLAVTAEVTPHHLAMWLPFEAEPDPPGLRKVNPPLRRQGDRDAMVRALREGLVDAVATDHAPHADADKMGDYADVAPGMIGLETALAASITLGGMGGEWLPTLVERLTAGPWRALGEPAGLRRPVLERGGLLSCTIFDPGAEWTVGAAPLRSRSRNTPLLGATLRGRVLLTTVDGDVVHLAEGGAAAGLARVMA